MHLRITFYVPVYNSHIVQSPGIPKYGMLSVRCIHDRQETKPALWTHLFETLFYMRCMPQCMGVCSSVWVYAPW